MKYRILSVFLFSSLAFFAQEKQEQKREPGHFNTNAFKQLDQEFATPNRYRTASGAPGSAYYQQQADYQMDIELDDTNKKIYGVETITYHNNSPDPLAYLWVQLDQNIRKQNAPTRLRDDESVRPAMRPSSFTGSFLETPFSGGFQIQKVTDTKNNPLPHTINNTMMRIDLPKVLAPGQKVSFMIKWWYAINDHTKDRGRSGYEQFPDSDNRSYVIAQFFPRMASYNDVEGWQNHQFWGNGEFALPFGNYKVNITLPADHIVEATGKLQNRKQVFTKTMLKRYEKAKTSFDKPVFIVTQQEAEIAEKKRTSAKKTWKFQATNVRDFAFAASRKFIWDMQAVRLPDNRTVMAVSLYPKEGNPLWQDYSTKIVASTLKSYSKRTFSYPYHKAISVHAKNQGMEYPMICWNYGRPDAQGNYSDRTKYGMMSVIIHEVGHNFFPMIVNSDERKWGWMDEGLDTFMQYLAEQDFGKAYPQAIAPHTEYPSRRGKPSKIVPYMSSDQSFLAPIMTHPENIYQLGDNAYGKPATALNILRETVMGPDLFDHAFKTYANRWKFKHPTPEDFFRTMEDASAVDLDWFWRGWFYSTDYVDMGVKDIKKYRVSATPSKQMQEQMKTRGLTLADLPPLVYLVEDQHKPNDLQESSSLQEYLMDNFSPQERAALKNPKYFYSITFEKPGGIPMPLLVKYTYKDGTEKMVRYPAELWRKNPKEVTKTIASDKELVLVEVDPNLETADIDTSNNTWPKKQKESEFDAFKKQLQK